MPAPFRQRSFAGGELSRRVGGRDDFAKHAIGLRRSRNGFASSEGAWHNRPGWPFVAETKDSADGVDRPVRFLPFVFSESPGQAYVLELGEGYVRFVVNGAHVAAPEPTSLAAWLPVTTFARGAWVESGGVSYYSLQDGNVGNDPATSPAWWTALEVYQVATPYAAADLARLKHAQQDDVLRLTARGYPPAELRRYGHQDWRYVETSFRPPPPFKLALYYMPVGVIAAGGAKRWAITAVYADGRESLPRISPPLRINLSDAGYPQFEWWCFDGDANFPRPVAFRVYRGGDGAWGFLDEVPFTEEGPLPGWQPRVIFEDKGQAADFTRSPPTWDSPWSPEPDPWVPGTFYYAGDRVTANGHVYEAQNAGRSAEAGAGPAATSGAVFDGLSSRKRKHTYVVGEKMVLFGLRYRCTVGGETADVDLPWGVRFIDNGLPWPGDGAATWTPEGDGNEGLELSDGIVWTYIAEAPARRSFPACVTSFAGRLGFAGTDDEPSTVRLSAVDDFQAFTRPTIGAADSALELGLLGRLREEVRWLVGLDRLLVGTQSSIWAIGPSGGAAVTTRAFEARTQSEAGASWLDPLFLPPDVVMYVRTKGCGVRDLVYDDSRGKFVGNDLVVLARHLFTGHEIVDWTYAEDPWSLAWLVREDGKLLSLTYQREQEVWAWAWHDTQGLVENVCAIPEGGEDAVYLCVKRQKGDGTWHRYIERMASRVVRLDEDAALTAAECVFLDSAVTARAVVPPMPGDGTTVFVAGLGHLEGLQVCALADGEVIDSTPDGNPLVVNGGVVEIATDDPAGYDVVHVGLLYASEFELLPLAAQGREIRTAVKKVVRVVLELEDSLGFELAERVVDRRGVATPDSEWHEWDPREVDDAYDPLELYTGEVSLSQFSSWNRAGIAAVRQRLPLPLTVLAATREVELGGS